MIKLLVQYMNKYDVALVSRTIVFDYGYDEDAVRECVSEVLKEVLSFRDGDHISINLETI